MVTAVMVTVVKVTAITMVPPNDMFETKENINLNQR